MVKKLRDLRSQRWYGPNNMRGVSSRARSRQMGLDLKISITNLESELSTPGVI